MLRRTLASSRFHALITLMVAWVALMPGVRHHGPAVHHVRSHSRAQTRSGQRGRSRAGWEMRESGHSDLAESLRSRNRDNHQNVSIEVRPAALKPTFVVLGMVWTSTPDPVVSNAPTALRGRAPPVVL